MTSASMTTTIQSTISTSSTPRMTTIPKIPQTNTVTSTTGVITMGNLPTTTTFTNISTTSTIEATSVVGGISERTTSAISDATRTTDTELTLSNNTTSDSKSTEYDVTMARTISHDDFDENEGLYEGVSSTTISESFTNLDSKSSYKKDPNNVYVTSHGDVFPKFETTTTNYNRNMDVSTDLVDNTRYSDDDMDTMTDQSSSKRFLEDIGISTRVKVTPLTWIKNGSLLPTKDMPFNSTTIRTFLSKSPANRNRQRATFVGLVSGISIVVIVIVAVIVVFARWLHNQNALDQEEEEIASVPYPEENELSDGDLDGTKV
ncbi:hypothetical protein LSH36_255g03074 [Paralvinella palmiformis]|uniref:Uncharacterized protein n=1 Tax=Paralvinella palmiformis TaxID=53620 RepID=A0AAD9N4M7_9ANNE|nr:hypothetical protein LSH36_255g03074 [Paralvinella palmiformis]